VDSGTEFLLATAQTSFAGSEWMGGWVNHECLVNTGLAKSLVISVWDAGLANTPWYLLDRRVVSQSPG